MFVNLISQQSLAWAKAGQVPVQHSVREAVEFKALKDQATLGTQIDVQPSAPSPRGVIADATGWVKALNESVLGIKEPQAAVRRSRSGTKILESNKKKYG